MANKQDVISIKLGDSVTQNMVTMTQVETDLNNKYLAARESRITLVQSVLMTASGLESLENYDIDINLENKTAVLTKKKKDETR